MSAGPTSLRLLTVEIRFEQDVVLARQRARQLAQALGFEGQIQTRIATAVSEIARNAFRYAGGGHAEFTFLAEAHPAKANTRRQTFVIEIRDSGPGISRLEEILAGRYRSASGLGIGIVGTRRLMDRVDVASSAHGTIVTLAKILPPSAPVLSAAQLQAIVDELSQREPAGPMEEMQVQNQELLRAMEELRLRQEELVRVNQELAETNTGVMALYDELETLNRISVMLASKVELRPLIQSIIEVTTSLTDAEIGAFFFREGDESWQLYASSGPGADVLGDFPAKSDPGFFGPDFAASGTVNVPDLDEHEGSCSGTGFAAAIARKSRVRSCLTVPVLDSSEKLIGAFIFTSSRPRRFTERSERILTSVATQAAVGIEKARLFQTVTAASDAKDQFFATLSHELRTPLNPALAIVSSLHDDARVPAELREDIALVARNIRLEARLIDDLLDFNRLIKGKLELVTDVMDVHELIVDVVEICREDLEAKNLTLTTHLDAARSAVVADSARLLQVLWNVLKNATKFTPPGGAISIRTRVDGERLRVEITDTGIGIEPASLERIFGAFDQGKIPIAAHFGGLGLGLSIARMFVDLHRGSIAAASDGPGKGATITIELPLCEAPARPHPAGKAQATGGAAVNARILLVDDHADTLRALSRLLQRRGFKVTLAQNGGEALQLAAGNSFDLLVSDLGLPDCSGLELIAKINAIRKLPAIALSGYGMEADIAQSRAAGFDVHITKPVDFERLLLAVNGLLSR
jgi:signal transduction histidine kinase